MARALLKNVLGYMQTGLSTVYDFNTSVGLMAIIKILDNENTNHIVAFGDTAGGNGAMLKASVTDNLRFVKINIGDISGTLGFAPVGVWLAVMGHSTSGGDVDFKSLNLETDAFAAETVANALAINTPTNDPAVIGNFTNPNAADTFKGTIDRAIIYQGANLSDDAFRGWARTGRLPQVVLAGLKGHWILWDETTLVDLSPNGNSMVLTGTGPFVTGGPVGLFTPLRAASMPLLLPEPAPVNGVNLPPYGQVIFNSADEENRPRFGQRIARSA